MPSKYLHGFYGLFTLAVAIFGIISIVFSFMWRRQDILLNMTFSHADLNGASLHLPTMTIPSLTQVLSLAGLVLGIAFLLTSFLSIGAIIQRNHVTIGLVILNWFLMADAVIVLVVGTMIWFYSLHERAEFHTQYAKLQPSQRITIQDQVTSLSCLLSCLRPV
jgi:hypothetical protein